MKPQLYVCGPLSMIGAVTTAAKESHWAGTRIRSEAFGASADGPRAPFRVTLAVAGRLADFPFPLTAGAYRYTANLQPGGQRQETEAGAWGETIVRAGPDYKGLGDLRPRVIGCLRRLTSKEIIPNDCGLLWSRSFLRTRRPASAGCEA